MLASKYDYWGNALCNSPNGHNGSSDETLCSGEDSRRAEQNERGSRKHSHFNSKILYFQNIIYIFKEENSNEHT